MTTNRYDMPIAFGPSVIPDYSEVPSADVAIISFLTDEGALQSILPEGFSLSGDAVVSVSFIEYRDVDYLGGRSYQEVVTSFPVKFKGADEAMLGGFAPILWVSDAGALMAGREFMGLPKLLANFTNSNNKEERSFEIAEYEAPILSGRAFGLKEVSSEQLGRIQERSKEVSTFGWKHIPAVGGKADLSYPLVNVMRWQYERVWTGSGELNFNRLNAQEAPFSSRAVAFLADLPVKEYRRSFVATGRAKIDRLATRRVG